MNRMLFLVAFFVGVLAGLSGRGAIIGTNVPAELLTSARIATLPAAQQPAWLDYLKRSEQQRRADQAALQQEMGLRGLTNSVVPPSSRGVGSMPLGCSAAWYGMQAGVRIADIIVSFQTPSGG